MKLHKLVAQELGLTWVRHLGNQVHLFRCPDSGQERVIRIMITLQEMAEVELAREDDEQNTSEIPVAFRRAFEQDDSPDQSQEDDHYDEPGGPISLREALDEIVRRWRGETL